MWIIPTHPTARSGDLAGSEILTPNLIVHGLPTMNQRTFARRKGHKFGSLPPKMIPQDLPILRIK